MSWFSVLLFSLTAAVLFAVVWIRLRESGGIDVQSAIALMSAAFFGVIAVTDTAAALRMRARR